MLTHERIVDAVKKAANVFPLTKVSYFGSYAEEKATDDSDLDLLVEFKEPAVSILTIIRLKRYLEEELAKSVDIIHAPLPQAAIIEIGKQVDILCKPQIIPDEDVMAISRRLMKQNKEVYEVLARE